nr:GPI inositol-deacylase A isoform X1 [Ipomoea batatas]
MIYRWQTLENNWCFHFVHWFLNLSYVVLSSKVVRIVASNPSLVIALVASTLVCFVHPALGLFLLLLSHAVCCQNALSSFLMASFRSHIQTKELRVSGNEQLNNSRQPIPKYNGETSKHVPLKANSPTSLENAKSYADTQLEIFHHRNSVSKVSSSLLEEGEEGKNIYSLRSKPELPVQVSQLDNDDINLWFYFSYFNFFFL